MSITADVIGTPTRFGFAYRRDQLERDRGKLLSQLERECFVPVTPLPAPPPVLVLDLARLHADAERVLRRWKYEAERRRRVLAGASERLAAICDLTLSDYMVPA